MELDGKRVFVSGRLRGMKSFRLGWLLQSKGAIVPKKLGKELDVLIMGDGIKDAVVNKAKAAGAQLIGESAFLEAIGYGTLEERISQIDAMVARGPSREAWDRAMNHVCHFFMGDGEEERAARHLHARTANWPARWCTTPSYWVGALKSDRRGLCKAPRVFEEPGDWPLLAILRAELRGEDAACRWLAEHGHEYELSPWPRQPRKWLPVQVFDDGSKLVREGARLTRQDPTGKEVAATEFPAPDGRWAAEYIGLSRGQAYVWVARGSATGGDDGPIDGHVHLLDARTLEELDRVDLPFGFSEETEVHHDPHTPIVLFNGNAGDSHLGVVAYEAVDGRLVKRGPEMLKAYDSLEIIGFTPQLDRIAAVDGPSLLTIWEWPSGKTIYSGYPLPEEKGEMPRLVFGGYCGDALYIPRLYGPPDDPGTPYAHDAIAVLDPSDATYLGRAPLHPHIPEGAGVVVLSDRLAMGHEHSWSWSLAYNLLPNLAQLRR